MTQAPTPGPLSAFRVGTNSGHGHAWKRPDGVKMRCGGTRICSECAKDAVLVADVVFAGKQTFAPTAPVEASGSEREPGDYTMALADPQPFEAFPALAAHIERMAVNGRLGSHTEWDSFLHEINTALSTTPARDEAQDEGAAGEFETAEAMAEAWSDRIEIQHMVETTSAVFAKWASPEILSRFRQQMMAVIQQAFIEGISARVEAIARAHPSPTPAADADRVRLRDDIISIVEDARNNVVSQPWDATPPEPWDVVSHAADRILAALKSTAAKEGGEV